MRDHVGSLGGRRCWPVGLAAGATTATGVTRTTDVRLASDGDRKTVTLITGDRVVARRRPLVSVTPGTGPRRHLVPRFHARRPPARRPARRRPDARRRPAGPAAVRRHRAGRGRLRRRAARHRAADRLRSTSRAPAGAQVTARCPPSDAVAAEVPKDDRAAGSALVSDPGVKKIWLDGMRKASLDRSVPQIGAPAAWEAGLHRHGRQGRRAGHRRRRRPTPTWPAARSPSRNFTDATRTPTTGSATARTSPRPSPAPAPRPAASTRASRRTPSCSTARCCDDRAAAPESWIIAGMEWAAEQGAEVVNMSLGGARHRRTSTRWSRP